MKRIITWNGIVLVIMAAALCMARPFSLFAIEDCELQPIQKQGFEDSNQVVGKYLGGKYAVHRQPIIFDLDLCINDPNLDFEIVGSVPVEGQTVTWAGDKGIHYLYFELRDKASQEVLDQGTVAVKCLPRGQFRGVVWQ